MVPTKATCVGFMSNFLFSPATLFEFFSLMMLNTQFSNSSFWVSPSKTFLVTEWDTHHLFCCLHFLKLCLFLEFHPHLGTWHGSISFFFLLSSIMLRTFSGSAGSSISLSVLISFILSSASSISIFLFLPFCFFQLS